MDRLKRLFLIIGASVLCAASAIEAKPKTKLISTPIIIGTTHQLHSDDLGEDRVINVVLPTSYVSERTRQYPVLYLIDGGVQQDLLHVSGVVQLGAMLGRSEQAIIVGIETKDRRKELTGPTRDPDLLRQYPTAGSSARFRDFIRRQVKPFISGRYRIDGRDAVLGESLAGLFVIETYLTEPSLFGGYGAVDPSLWWDNEALSKTAAQKIGDGQKGRPLLLAVAKEQSKQPAAYQRTLAGLRDKAMTFCLSLRPDQTHATLYQQITPEAVQYLMPTATAPSVESGLGLNCHEQRP
jgi:predicted alpha/beta superfamily hydrolase